MNKYELKNIAEKWIEAWNVVDEARIRELYADDVELYQAPVKKSLVGIEHILSRTKDFASMSDNGVMTANAIHVTENNIILEVNVTGIHNGKFLDYEPTGRKLDIDTCVILTIKDQKIVRHTTYLDTATILRSLSLIEVPGTKAEAA